ncbi:MAG: S46 family peptidase [Deltaproteobacteria bacterium]|nr:S46 family peptidase [Deltaproteobacteria bacterium]
MRARTWALALTLYPSVALADEGMWTFDQFPADRVGAYGFTPGKEWLDHVRLSAIRLAGGCSASLISADGLVLTNHHCAHDCIEKLSTPAKNFVEGGFLAKSTTEEKVCPAMEANQLVDISDVTARIQSATKGLEGEKFADARKAEIAAIEKACAKDDATRCDVVTLYQGGKYALYTYRRFQDVRLVFAPELAIAFFGGDPDNFEFPRYDLDMAMVRIYQDGKPAHFDHHLAWSKSGLKDLDPTFVVGNPGSTRRLETVAEITYQRDVNLPARLIWLAELRGVLSEFSARGKEQARIARTWLFYVENSFKAYRGEHAALLDPALFESKVARQKSLRDEIAKRPELQKDVGSAFEEIERAVGTLRQIRTDYFFKESRGFLSDLFGHARTLVRLAEETAKPNGERLEDFTDSRLPAVRAELTANAPIYPELEITSLTYSLTKLREELGADDPFVKMVLGKDSPRALAIRLVRGTKLAKLDVRKHLMNGGAKAIETSNDPMIALAKLVDKDARAVRKRMEDEVEAPILRAQERISRARFAVLGTSTYPDATFTLRLSYGRVRGYQDNGKPIAPFTTLGGAFTRATGSDPFALPLSWLRAEKKLALDTPFNFVTDNDIIGGNSGSPVIDKNGELVGLVFDGNIFSLGGDYGFEAATNRTVAVDVRAITESLDRIYGANRILKEAGVR